eukprot:6130031-Pleurochrysis_carterae.AAC.1
MIPGGPEAQLDLPRWQHPRSSWRLCELLCHETSQNTSVRTISKGEPAMTACSSLTSPHVPFSPRNGVRRSEHGLSRRWAVHDGRRSVERVLRRGTAPRSVVDVTRAVVAVRRAAAALARACQLCRNSATRCPIRSNLSQCLPGPRAWPLLCVHLCFGKWSQCERSLCGASGMSLMVVSSSEAWA